VVFLSSLLEQASASARVERTRASARNVDMVFPPRNKLCFRVCLRDGSRLSWPDFTSRGLRPLELPGSSLCCGPSVVEWRGAHPVEP
jgi:hypothetical protein